MPIESEHLQKAEYNETFYQSFDLNRTQYYDWVVNGIFYSVLHYIEAYLATQNLHSLDHADRNAKIRSDNNLGRYVYKKYMELKDDSEGGRYRMQNFTPGEIRQDMIPKLDEIKEHLKRYVPKIRLA